VDAVLMNTAIAAAQDPVAMGSAMRHAVIAGRMAYLAGRMSSRTARPDAPMVI
jgi:thiazole synthase